jgi:hypothetical protein
MGGLTAVAAAGAALAAGTSPPLPLIQPELITGTLTYTWHGDPARNCGAQGLCGSHGALIVEFDGYGQLFLASHGATANLQSASATVRVRRDDPNVQPGECVDAQIVLDFGIRLNRDRAGRYMGSFAQAPGSSGRCAGPLVTDLARLHLPAIRFGKRGLGFDLRGRTPFVAGPFSGELVSTVLLRPDLSQSPGSSTGSSSGTSFGAPPAPPRPVTIFIEYARLRYRIRGATGTLETAFTGDPEPLCQPLDSCGVAGALRVAVNGYAGQFQLSFSRQVARRAGRRRALADLRAGRLTDEGIGLVAAPVAVVSEAETRAGAPGCQDATAVRLPLQIGGSPFGAATGPLQVGFGSVTDQTDPLRTHCAGPSTGDVAGLRVPFGPGFGGPSVSIATGSIPTRLLGSRSAVVAVANPGGFSEGGYSGTRSGSLQFTLTLTSIATGTRAIRVFR